MIAGIEYKSRDFDAANRDYHEALLIAKKINHQDNVATIIGKLADLAIAREQLVEAESLAREALSLAEKVGKQVLIADDCHRLAKALLKQNKDLEEALSTSRRAVEIFMRLRHPDLQEAQETLKEIEEVRMKNEE